MLLLFVVVVLKELIENNLKRKVFFKVISHRFFKCIQISFQLSKVDGMKVF